MIEFALKRPFRYITLHPVQGYGELNVPLIWVQ